jgi:hypothetical protein
VVHIVEEALDVSIDDPPTADQYLLDRPYGLPRTTPGSIPVRARQEIRLEERLDDNLACLLDHPIANGWDAQLTRTSIRLRNLHPQHRLRTIRLRLQVRGEIRKVRLDAVAFHLFDGDAIDACAPSIGSHFYPGPPQHIGPDDAVIQSVEPTAPTPLGRKVQSALEVS